MDRQTKLDVLQKELSRKDLDMWCRIKTSSEIWTIVWFEFKFTKTCVYVMRDSGYMWEFTDLDNLKSIDWFEILWHNSLLSDVLVWLKGLRIFCQIDWTGMLYIRLLMVDEDFIRRLNRDLTKPYLSEQSDEVINGIYEVFLSLSQSLLTKKY